jgi:hypothetical protein
MGYYFPKAKTVANLNPEQSERYKTLRSPGTELPSALKDRFQAIKERIGHITSGEIWSAFEELWQDAVVCWILSGENPEIEWTDLHTEEKEPTEGERQRAKGWWDNFFREMKEREEREKRELDVWERTNYPVRYFFRKLFARFRSI